jgi:hypothetical protein
LVVAADFRAALPAVDSAVVVAAASLAVAPAAELAADRRAVVAEVAALVAPVADLVVEPRWRPFRQYS